ncbi:hypothetical protein K7X08_015172 [Anisodus acutangulus]|uniref:Uncharacterized protein n=1 Tax=Anisodus acutangulus TaxID=402998 RepID=A0A9Q1L2Y4_9SOLA|nr:hypothetical protein K7X08_015172 [Anisodus acutangulus]
MRILTMEKNLGKFIDGKPINGIIAKNGITIQNKFDALEEESPIEKESDSVISTEELEASLVYDDVEGEKVDDPGVTLGSNESGVKKEVDDAKKVDASSDEVVRVGDKAAKDASALIVMTYIATSHKKNTHKGKTCGTDIGVEEMICVVDPRPIGHDMTQVCYTKLYKETGGAILQKQQKIRRSYLFCAEPSHQCVTHSPDGKAVHRQSIDNAGVMEINIDWTQNAPS